MNKVKSATVGIGLAIKETYTPTKVVGSGFFVSNEGHVMTATHVIKRAIKEQEEYSHSRVDTELVIFWNASTPTGIVIHTVPIAEKVLLKPGNVLGGEFVGFRDFDVTIARVKGKGMPYLNIKQDRTELYDEVAICGYPSGEASLTFNRQKRQDVRISPILQFGKVTAYLPDDNYLLPYGLQTDIVVTGGSSGSPIVEVNTGEVIGLVQRVITNQESDIEPIGLAFGMSNNILRPFLKNAIVALKTRTFSPFSIEVGGMGKFRIIKHGE